MLKFREYLVLGIGTEIGKTYLTEKICAKNPAKIIAIKPVITGINGDNFFESDSAKILKALEKKVTLENIKEISPWSFEQPISPHLAGFVDFLELKEFCAKKILAAKKEKKILFIESAGGVMSPINQDKTFLDLAIELQIPTILVSANYLGAISHTLTALDCLKNSKILVEKIIVNSILPPPISNQEFINSLANFTKVQAITLPDFINSLNII